MNLAHRRSFRRVPFFSTTQHTKARQENTTAAISSSPSSSSSQRLALSIPEILERILSFLPLPSRQSAARLVCKEWSAICKGLIPVTYTWILRLTPNDTKTPNDADNDESNAIRELISFAHNITIRVDDDTLLKQSIQQRLASWTTMMDVLHTMALEHAHRRVHLRLRSLHLREGIIENFSVQLPQLPQLTTLTTLQIDMVRGWDIIHLFTILRACPHLEDLSIKPTPVAHAKHQAIDLSARGGSTITAIEEHALIHGELALPTMSQLRTCSLYDLILTLPALSAFLQASPRLSKLVLPQCSQLVRVGQDTTTLRNHAESSTVSIIRLVGMHCPSIRTFHASVAGRFGYLDSQDITALLDTFPHLEEFNFSTQKISQPLFTTFCTAVANRITTLNLLPLISDRFVAQWVPLRQILCTFEHLLHLRAPNSVYSLDDMDLNDVKSQLQQLWARKHSLVGPTSRSPPRIAKDDPAVARQYVWACRGLRTLHMTVDHYGVESDFSEMSLIIFGFLSRMCPRLQELSLKRNQFDLSLQGGLCLLTRLQELERLRIITNDCPPMNEQDLLWVHPAPPSTWDRLAYPLLRHRTSKDLQARYDGIVPTENMSKLVERGRELGMDLSKIGYGDDLLDWIDERCSSAATTGEDSSRRPFQLLKLQSFWIECREEKDKKRAAPQKLQEYVAKIRPEVDFDLCKGRRDDFYETTLRYY